MLLLSNGCTSSNPTVTPKNWKKGGKGIMKGIIDKSIMPFFVLNDFKYENINCAL